jgi:hypothetical protein
LDLWALFIHFIRRVSGFRLEILSAITLLSVVAVFRRTGMTRFDFARAGAIPHRPASNPVTHSVFQHPQRVRPRAGLGAIGTLLVLMGVAMGVLTIRFILVFAHTVLQ